MAAPATGRAGEEALARAKALYGRLTPDSTQAARDLLDAALADPAGMDDAVAAECRALLADILTCDYLNRWNGADAAELDDAKRLVEAALRSRPDLPLAHYAQGFVWRAQGEHEKALLAYTRTIELNPDFVRADAHQAAQLLYLGRLDEVAPLVETAIARTAPGNLALGMFYWILARADFYAGRYDAAIGWLSQSIEIRPNLWYNRLYLVSAYALTGRSDAAADALRAFDALFPGYTVARVIRDEAMAPKHHPVVAAGKQRFHAGLIAAGMPES